MKVLCIDVSNGKHIHLFKPEHYIIEGEVYTVCDIYHDNTDGHDYYFLAERRMVPTPSYRANRFIPLEDLPEEEINEEEISKENFITDLLVTEEIANLKPATRLHP